MKRSGGLTNLERSHPAQLALVDRAMFTFVVDELLKQPAT
jgi:hypothetical protein